MKTIKIIAIVLIVFGCKNDKKTSITKDNIPANAKELIIIEQDYKQAIELAAKEDKMLFIDFYTTWCAPCKKLDKLVFQNDSIKKILKNDVILLRYDAENDSVFHLSKKHHISSYPTGLLLTKEGYVLNRKYGFPGADFKSLSNNVLEFVNESVKFNKENKILKGYSNKIDASKYPKFYVDYVNRSNTKINNSELSDYLISTQDKFSEEYFSTLIYFGSDAPENIANMVLNNKQKYINLYGKKDVETLLYFLTYAKFKVAISEINQEKYDEAVAFTKNALSQEWVNDILPNYEKDYLKAQNKWNEVFEINKKLKDNGKLDNGYINHFSWQVYEDCNDQQVVKKCLEWMKVVTNEEPIYAYLDTYAHLMYKSGNKQETKRIAKLAIEAAKKENEKTTSIEKLVNKI
jgi:thiol-disulfide isomerase/thioredoxin